MVFSISTPSSYRCTIVPTFWPKPLETKKHLHRAEEKRNVFREILEDKRLDVALPSSLSERSTYLTKVVQKFGGGPVANETATTLLTNGEETFTEIIQAIESAQHHIHIQYYIYRSDDIGTKIRDALIKKQNPVSLYGFFSMDLEAIHYEIASYDL